MEGEMGEIILWILIIVVQALIVRYIDFKMEGE